MVRFTYKQKTKRNKKTAYRNNLYWHPLLHVPWLILTLKDFKNVKGEVWNGITLIITHLGRKINGMIVGKEPAQILMRIQTQVYTLVSKLT